jgi:hypothetical protein
MSGQLCPRCGRVNPGAAQYCYYDGVVLRAGVHGAVPRLPREFVFPSGRRCGTFEELAQGCQDEWTAARALLKEDAFRRYFMDIGRVDLANAAQEASFHANADLGMVRLTQALPVPALQSPRLDLHPRRIDFGKRQVGETLVIPLTINNQGQGVLQGTITIQDGGDWLRFAESAGVSAVIHTPNRQVVSLVLDTAHLSAARTYGALLVVATNGGMFEAPVQVEALAAPFGKGPFQGVVTPRQLAERMRAAPKLVGPILENGEVQQWFARNNWSYPVVGIPAKGVAGVQQFFEAMGLSRPPLVHLSHEIVNIPCRYPEPVRFQVTLQTPSKKWVYGQASSNCPWLRVLTPHIAGAQQATLGLEIDPRGMESYPPADGHVEVLANGGRKLSLRVQPQVANAPRRALGAGGALRPVVVMMLTLLLARLFLTPMLDFLAHPGAVALAARQVQLPIAESGVLDRVGGWLALPWGVFVTNGSTNVPRQLFDGGEGVLSALDLSAFGHYAVQAFLWRVVGWTFWLGPALGAVWMLRHGAARELAWGIIAGIGLGVMGGASLGCVVLLFDLPAYGLWTAVCGHSGGPGWLVLWIMIVTLIWMAWGAALGLLLHAVPVLRHGVLPYAQRPLGALLRRCGLSAVAKALDPRQG